MALPVIKSHIDFLKSELKKRYPSIVDRTEHVDQDPCFPYTIDFYMNNLGIQVHAYASRGTGYDRFAATLYYYDALWREWKVSRPDFGLSEKDKLLAALVSFIDANHKPSVNHASSMPIPRYALSKATFEHSMTIPAQNMDPWTPISKLVDILETLVQSPVSKLM